VVAATDGPSEAGHDGYGAHAIVGSPSRRQRRSNI